MSGPKTGDASDIPPQNRRPSRSSTNAGDFYAPYFDVAFYSADADAKKMADFSSLGPTGNQAADQAIFQAKAAVQAQQAAVAAATAFKATQGDLIQGSLYFRSDSGRYLIFNPTSGAEEVWKMRSHLTIEAVNASSYKATVTLQPPYEMALKLIGTAEEPSIIQYGSLMLVEWGYMGNAASDGRRIRDRGIFNIVQPSVRFGKQITIQIVGWDMLSSSMRTIGSRIIWQRKGAFIRDIGIVEDILKRHKLKLVDKTVEKARRATTAAFVAAGAITEDVVEGGTVSPIWKKKEKPITQTWNDWDFFRWLLESNDATFDQRGGEVVIYDISQRAVEAPDFNLLWYQQPRAPNDIPMIEFDANSIPSLFARDGSRGWFTTHTDNTTGEDIQKKTTPKKDKGKGAGTNKSTAGNVVSTQIVRTPEGDIAAFEKIDDDDKRRGGGTMLFNGDDPNIATESAVLVDRTARVANTHADVTIPGHPGIIPLMNVHVSRKALGIFGGNYRVLRVVHDIGSGYTTKLKLYRDSSVGDERQERVPTMAGGNEGNKDAKRSDASGADGDVILPVVEDPSSDLPLSGGPGIGGYQGLNPLGGGP